MKKTKMITIFLAAALSIMLLAGCQKQYEVATYQGELEEGQKSSDYNKELFYRNDIHTDGADPFILDNRERDGYFYQYVTEGLLICYRSTNLMDWEAVGPTLDTVLEYGEDNQRTEINKLVDHDIWAPEVVYDSETELYYMYFSATSVKDPDVVAGEGVASEEVPFYMGLVATSKQPDRGFTVVDFTDPESCGAENVHTYNKTPGLKDENGEYIPAFPHYYAKYFFLDPQKYNELSEKTFGFAKNNNNGYTGAIDFSPYVDEDGTKYLYWSDNYGENAIMGVKMINWLQPDWSTATALTMVHYYTMEDYYASRSGKTVDKVSYELSKSIINEGVQMFKHNGKYYLSYSMNSYGDSSYQLGQAIADSPLGPFRKLNDEEGAIFLSGGTEGSREVSGSGHHTLIEIDGHLYNFYHRHDSVEKAGTERNGAVDEVKWITIKDKDGNDLDVMYTNGPTWTVQPRLEPFTEWKNIADEAKVSGSDDAKYLTDGLLSLYKYANASFMEYIKETVIKKDTTFTFEFNEARPVRAIMVYESKMEQMTFKEIKNIQLICEEDGKEVIRYIDNLKLSKDCYTVNELNEEIYYIKPGASIYAEFEELNVKAVKITIEVPEEQESVGISEVRILGK